MKRKDILPPPSVVCWSPLLGTLLSVCLSSAGLLSASGENQRAWLGAAPFDGSHGVESEHGGQEWDRRIVEAQKEL